MGTPTDEATNEEKNDANNNNNNQTEEDNGVVPIENEFMTVESVRNVRKETRKRITTTTIEYNY